MGQLTSTTSSFTFLKSQLASSLAPLQVHPGRGGTPTPSQLIYFMLYYSPICWYPLLSLLINILLHGREMSTALSRSPRHWSSTRWERWTWKLLAIELFYEVCILCFDVRFQVVRMADYLSRSHPPFSPSSLSSHSPQRSTCRCLTYKHRIRHYILKCCSIFHSTLILLSTLYILVIWYYGFQCRWLPFVLSMSSLFDVVAAMTPGSWNMT